VDRAEWERLQSDRARLESGQVTDFLETTDICLALLSHKLDTAPQGQDEDLEGQDEDLREESRAAIAALRLAQEVYNDLFPRADTTIEERAHFAECLLAVGEGSPPLVQEILAAIGEAIMKADYHVLLYDVVDQCLDSAVDWGCHYPAVDEVCHYPASAADAIARWRRSGDLQAKLGAVLQALGSLREEAPQEVARALPPLWRAYLREEGCAAGTGLQAGITYLGELLRCLWEPALLDEERAAREEEERVRDLEAQLLAVRHS
jgi:hypothetical protein